MTDSLFTYSSHMTKMSQVQKWCTNTTIDHTALLLLHKAADNHTVYKEIVVWVGVAREGWDPAVTITQTELVLKVLMGISCLHFATCFTHSSKNSNCNLNAPISINTSAKKIILFL